VTVSTARSLRDSARFWWILNRERAGLAIVVLVLAPIFALFRPVGHPIPLTGVVTAINVQDAKRHPPFNAWVDLGGSQTVVELEAGHGCVVGSRIKLEKSRFSFARRFFGEHYAVARHGCDVPPTAER
jgi:hypothetical protein